MKILRRWRSLPGSERRLLAEAAVLLALVRLGLWVLPFRRLRAILASYGRRTTREAMPADRIAWAVAASGRRLPGTCLALALAAQAMLARRGHTSALRIGVARSDGGALLAHAWVESQGRVILDAGEDPAGYVPLQAL